MYLTFVNVMIGRAGNVAAAATHAENMFLFCPQGAGKIPSIRFCEEAMVDLKSFSLWWRKKI
jgi:hypothetical protein